jgi:hypothetical protein
MNQPCTDTRVLHLESKHDVRFLRSRALNRHRLHLLACFTHIKPYVLASHGPVLFLCQFKRAHRDDTYYTP